MDSKGYKYPPARDYKWHQAKIGKRKEKKIYKWVLLRQVEGMQPL